MKDGFIAVADVVVTPLEAGATAAISCVIDGVTQVYQAVLKTVQAALNMAETAFSTVEVLFAKLFEWAGFLFNWADILRTHTAISYIFNEFLTFLADAADGLKQLADTALTGLSKQIDSAFTAAIQQVGGTTSLGGYFTSAAPAAQLPAEARAGMSNTVVANALIDNAAAATITPPPGQTQPGQPPGLDKKLRNFARHTKNTRQFAKFKHWFTTLGSSPDQMFTALLGDLLKLIKNLIRAILNRLQHTVDALLDQVAALISDLRQSLNAAWNIPLLSALYSKISNGAELTTLDLIALVIAVPATITYKAIQDKAPFPDDTSLTTFRASVNAQSMLQASGLATTTASTTELRSLSLVRSRGEQAFLLVLTGVTTALTGLVSMFPDAKPPEESVSEGYTMVLIAFQAFVLVPSFPAFYSIGPSSGFAWGMIQWMFGIMSLIIDVVLTKNFGGMAEYIGDVGVVWAFVFGVVKFSLAIFASLGGGFFVWLGNLATAFPEVAKICRYMPLAKATENVSCVVLAGIDLVCGLASYVGYAVQAATLPAQPAPSPP